MSLEGPLQVIGTGIFMFVILSAVREGTIHGSMTASALGFLTVPLLLCLFITRRIRVDVKLSERGNLIALATVVLLGVALRLAWILHVPTVPVSDYEQYHLTALDILSGNVPEEPPKPLGYPLILAGLYSIHYDPLIGKLANVLIAPITIICVFSIARTIGSGPGSLIAAALMAIWPADIAMTSVLNSDTWAAMFISLSIHMLIRGASYKRYRYSDLLLSGMALGAAVLIRPISLMFGSGVFYHFFDRDRDVRLHLVLAFLLGLIVVVGGGCAWHSLTSGHPSMGAIMYEGSGYSILAGSNIEARGTWNQEDYQLYHSLPKDIRFQMIVKKVWQRASSDPWKFLGLLFEKVEISLGNDMHGVYWATLKTDPCCTNEAVLNSLYAISQGFYLLLLAGCLLLFIAPGTQWSRARLLAAAYILPFVAGSLVIEAQGRYHHVITPLMSALAATSIMAKHLRVLSKSSG
jgi:hypothetical protein